MDKPEPRFSLQIFFPKSSEDQRLQLISINGSIFAIFYSPLESQGPIRLLCEDWSLILLAPIKSKTHVLISGINVICLNEISSEEGNVSLHAANRLVKVANLINSPEKISELGENGEFQNDDPGAVLYFHRLFNSIVNSIHIQSDELFSDAQKSFMSALCTLVDKIKKKSEDSENLTLLEVFKFWDIPLNNQKTKK